MDRDSTQVVSAYSICCYWRVDHYYLLPIFVPIIIGFAWNGVKERVSFIIVIRLGILCWWIILSLLLLPQPRKKKIILTVLKVHINNYLHTCVCTVCCGVYFFYTSFIQFSFVLDDNYVTKENQIKLVLIIFNKNRFQTTTCTEYCTVHVLTNMSDNIVIKNLENNIISEWPSQWQ